MIRSIRVEQNELDFMVHETDGKFHPAAQGGCGHIHAGEWENELKDSAKVRIAVKTA